MIQYRAGKWGLLFAFSLGGSVFPKALVFALPCAVTTVILHILFQEEETSRTVNMGDGATDMFAGFNFILGFLIVFRSNIAYSRWWEGGGLLQQLRGEWFNAFSSCLAFCNAAPDRQEDVTKFQHQLVRLMSMLYGSALSEVSEMDDNRFDFIEFHGFDGNSLEFLQGSHNKCEIVLQWIQRLIHEASGTEVVKVAPPILSRVFNQLGNGIVILNNAKKLNEFPIPFPLAQMILLMLGLHWVLMTIMCAATVESPIWAGIVCFAVVFSFWSIHYISEQLEQPFGDDSNDLPIREMQVDLNSSLLALMKAEARFPPPFKYDPIKHSELKIEYIAIETYLTDFVELRHSQHSGLWVDGPADAEVLVPSSSAALTVKESDAAATSLAGQQQQPQQQQAQKQKQRQDQRPQPQAPPRPQQQPQQQQRQQQQQQNAQAGAVGGVSDPSTQRADSPSRLPREPAANVPPSTAQVGLAPYHSHVRGDLPGDTFVEATQPAESLRL